MIYYKIFKIQRSLILARYGYLALYIINVFYPKNLTVSELKFWHPFLEFLANYTFHLIGISIAFLFLIITIIFIDNILGIDELIHYVYELNYFKDNSYSIYHDAHNF